MISTTLSFEKEKMCVYVQFLSIFLLSQWNFEDFVTMETYNEDQ